MSVGDVDSLSTETYPCQEKLVPGVFAVVQADGGWGLSNAGLICADGVSVLVDTFFTESRNRILREMVTATASAPPDFIVNTHHHGDHVYGNGWFPEATVVSHTSTRDAVLRMDAGASARRFTTVDFGEARPTPAALTYETSARIHVGDMTVEAFFPGVAHCAGNTAVFVPERSVLFAGDLLLSNCTPTFVGGSARGFLPVLDLLRNLDAEHVVPGHGALCSAGVIDETERYVRFVLDLAADGLAKGRTPLEIARGASLGEFESWLDNERIVGNLYRAMHELGGEAAESRIDMPAMWRDTEAWLGRPVHSHA
ncbi:MBL fold metallo-hydrolase [Amycolatopsis alkalitolerans]|uniref:MBL fold metallo-hydrolase n=1 Tax=Amycolatopsis alkalitolerans TaxID=2547244 RepID=A0A5C4M9G5_9PSEU|nr:MBL fold metallo-hydrolase [Amycolatopsis alkalitolerans]TNC29228.1 MBL fold metallo-hydrolase [Amycolatopsis alkalitolerans]